MPGAWAAWVGRVFAVQTGVGAGDAIANPMHLSKPTLFVFIFNLNK